jgi:hypothetical protein
LWLSSQQFAAPGGIAWRPERPVGHDGVAGHGREEVGAQVGFDIGTLGWAAGILAVLMLAMRWVFKPSRPRTGRPESGPDANLGLLTPVLSRAPRAEALRVKNLLSQQGIRCSVSRLDRETYDVLVFNRDADRARELLEQ